MPDVRLTWENLTTHEVQERLEQLPITLGRSTDATITLNSDQISRQHATIQEDGETVVIVDNQSTNGTKVNGDPITRREVVSGDSIQIGPFALTVEIIQNLQAAVAENSVALSWTDTDTGQSAEAITELPAVLGRSANVDVTLADEKISRQHAIIERQGDQIVIRDQGSANGTYVNGQRVETAALNDGDVIRMGDHEIVVSFSLSVSDMRSSSVIRRTDSTLLFDEQVSEDVRGSGLIDPASVSADEEGTIGIDPEELPFTPEGAPGSAVKLPTLESTFPPPSFTEPVVSVAELRAGEYPVEETKYLAVGGGLGSFIWVDNLIIYGASPSDIVSIGFEEKPYGRYRRLCENSQIPSHERLRSNSDSTPDCIWGWPGYAVREIWDDITHLRFGNAIKVGWQIFGEPTLIATYTPKSGQVFDSIDREAKRISWNNIWRYGRVRAIRKTDDGRYAIAYSQSTDEGRVRKIILAKFVHVSIGYPGVRFLRDLQEYRQNTGDFKHVVNAYEEHAHVYEDLRLNGGTVLIRGRGIVASRIIQKLHETRRENSNISMLHLMRSPVLEGQKAGLAQRPVENHWEFQPFNWPKSAWGGDLRYKLEASDDDARDQLLNDWGGTTTADRLDWKRIVSGGIRDGWYVIRFGNVDRVERNADGHLDTIIRGAGSLDEETHLVTDYIIDATGLESGIDRHPLLKDLLETYNLKRNPKGRLNMANTFEIRDMDNNGGKMYSAGVATLGGPYAPVDSFLGLQYSVQRSVDDLAKSPDTEFRKLGFIRSFFQWVKWATNRAP